MQYKRLINRGNYVKIANVGICYGYNLIHLRDL